MKKGIHPELKSVEVVCNTCNTKFTTETTKTTLDGVEVCSNCHPFYTGKTKNVSKGGRIDKFNAKYGQAKTTSEK